MVDKKTRKKADEASSGLLARIADLEERIARLEAARDAAVSGLVSADRPSTTLGAALSAPRPVPTTAARFSAPLGRSWAGRSAARGDHRGGPAGHRRDGGGVSRRTRARPAGPAAGLRSLGPAGPRLGHGVAQVGGAAVGLRTQGSGLKAQGPVTGVTLELGRKSRAESRKAQGVQQHGVRVKLKITVDGKTYEVDVEVAAARTSDLRCGRVFPDVARAGAGARLRPRPFRRCRWPARRPPGPSTKRRCAAARSPASSCGSRPSRASRSRSATACWCSRR